MAGSRRGPISSLSRRGRRLQPEGKEREIGFTAAAAAGQKSPANSQSSSNAWDYSLRLQARPKAGRENPLTKRWGGRE